MRALLHRPAIVALLIGIAAQLLFSLNVTRPSTLYFDEVHYVPAARAMLAGEAPRNIEHPPLAKELVAAGIAVFGDNALGWRAMSTLAGTATIIGVFAILMLLFASIRTAAFGALFAAVNVSVFIHARIAMMEPFLGAFVTLGIAALLWAMRAPPDKVVLRWLLGGVLLGGATAVKWTAAPYIAFAAIAFIAIRAKQVDLWPGLSVVRAIAILGLASTLTYFVTFIPLLRNPHSPPAAGDLLSLQWEMFRQQTQVLAPHPYQSNWLSWPLDIRPIWYLYEAVDGAQRGVLMVGNPVIWWGGLLAVFALGWAWWKDRSAKAGAIALLWVASLAIWTAIPKSLGFLYYYHLSSIFLCVALSGAFHIYDTRKRARWIECYALVAVAAFCWLYPIISAASLANDQQFNRWMIMDSWR